PQLARRWSLRRVMLVGFACNIVSMALLALTRRLLGAPDTAFGVLLVATGALGLGFGATVMALNTYAEAFFPQRADGSVLALECAAWAEHRFGTGAGRDRCRPWGLVAAPRDRGLHYDADLRQCSYGAIERLPGDSCRWRADIRRFEKFAG